MAGIRTPLMLLPDPATASGGAVHAAACPQQQPSHCLSSRPYQQSLTVCLLQSACRLPTRMCGIIGIFKHDGEVNVELYEGLLMLQHRCAQTAKAHDTWLVATLQSRSQRRQPEHTLHMVCSCMYPAAAACTHSNVALAA